MFYYKMKHLLDVQRNHNVRLQGLTTGLAVTGCCRCYWVQVYMFSLCFALLWIYQFLIFSCDPFTRTLQWRHNGRDSVSNHQPHDCSLKRLFMRRSKKTAKLRVTGLCAGNSLGTSEFPVQMASNTHIVSIWWRHHDISTPLVLNNCI